MNGRRVAFVVHRCREMLEYWWMASNASGRNGSDDGVLQDPGSAILFVGYPRWLLCFAAVCCVLFMLVGIPGNLITVIALFRTKKLRNATAVFIMNLSISDLMFCCFNLPLATSTFWHSSWHHGPLLCRLFPLLRYGLVAVSLFTVLAITINRYVMIGHPGLYPALYKTRYLIPMVLAIWIMAFGVLIVTWFEVWGRFGLDPGIGSCSILPDEYGRSPKEFLFVLAFLTPCLAIVVCYARIFYIVRKTASKSRGRGRCANAEPAEVSHERRSTSTRNHEEELSVPCAPSSSTQAIFLRPDGDEIDLERSSRSADGGSSCSRSPRPGYQREANSATTRSRTDGSATSECVRLDVRSNDRYDALRASPMATTASEDIPFADETDLAETRRFLNGDRSSREQRRAESRTSCGRLGRTMAGRASFVVESPSLWRRDAAAAAAADDRSDRQEVAFAGVDSRSPERSSARRAFRRESRFRGANGEPSPRMSAKDRRLLQMILVIFSSFLVCYLPITVTKLFRDAVDWRGLNIAGYILIYLTTCINPIIYVVMSSEYRNAYKYVLLCKREQATGKRRLPGLLMPG